MPLRYDATLKDIVTSRPRDFEAALDLPSEPVQVLNVDLSTLSAATDVALGYSVPLERIVDLNFQASFAENLTRRVLLYNAMLHLRYNVPIHSQVVLLRPAADAPGLTGQIAYAGVEGRGKLDFTFEVIRLWLQPAERFLTGGLGALPLATLCQMPPGIPLEDALRPVIRAIDDRLRAEASPDDAAKLLTAAYVLIGMRLPPQKADPLFEGTSHMQESATYQGILDKGRIEQARKDILRFGKKRLGPPGAGTEQFLATMQDLDRLDRILERLVDSPETVSHWQDLLDTP
jgi:hypothetical protein